MTRGFDVGRALADIARAFWLDLPAIALSGLLTVAIPIGCSFWFASGGGADVLIILAQGFTACLFAAIVAHGVLARRQGAPLPPVEFVLRGLRASQPGVNVGLVFASALMIVPIALSLTQALAMSDLTTLFVRLGAVGIAVAIIVRLVPVISAAVAERLGPLAALRRADTLTLGHRVRLMFVTAVIGWAALLLPALTALAVFGVTPDHSDRVLTELRGGWFDLRVWLLVASITLGGGMIATLPPIAYLHLRHAR